MFDQLIASKATKQRTFTQGLTSLVLHVLVIYGVVQVTQGAAEAVRDIIQDTTIVFLAPPKTTPPPPEAPPPEAIVSANPPPRGFQTVVAPEAIPTEIPPINVAERFNPDDFTGKGVEGGIAAGIVGGTGDVPVSGEVFLEAELDDPPRVISPAQPRYPPVLQSAGISGRVIYAFVVDTTGHAEGNSFKLKSSTNKAFEAPAREAILKTVFKPGRVQGRPVRVLVVQAVAFNANR
ncbi:MAG: energy transducer TonB [Gemmatimonadales bacterium]|nr:MAG: energy transducer TonB [Gemmatimonadales bacterium]